MAFRGRVTLASAAPPSLHPHAARAPVAREQTVQRGGGPRPLSVAAIVVIGVASVLFASTTVVAADPGATGQMADASREPAGGDIRDAAGVSLDEAEDTLIDVTSGGLVATASMDRGAGGRLPHADPGQHRLLPSAPAQVSSDATARVGVRTIDDDDDPVPNATVRLIPGDPDSPRRTFRTDRDGITGIKTVEAGLYRVDVWAEGYRNKSTSVNLTPNDLETIDVRLTVVDRNTTADGSRDDSSTPSRPPGSAEVTVPDWPPENVSGQNVTEPPTVPDQEPASGEDDRSEEDRSSDLDWPILIAGAIAAMAVAVIVFTLLRTHSS